MPLAVPGRWRATTSPPIRTRSSWRMVSRSRQETVPSGSSARSSAIGWRPSVSPVVA